MELLELVVKRDFSQVSERVVAERLGVTQAVLNSVRNGNGGVGVRFLEALRAYTGMSIDEILGLPPPSAVAGALSPGQREALRAYLLDELEALEPGTKERFAKKSHVVADRKHPRKPK